MFGHPPTGPMFLLQRSPVILVAPPRNWHFGKASSAATSASIPLMIHIIFKNEGSIWATKKNNGLTFHEKYCLFNRESLHIPYIIG